MSLKKPNSNFSNKEETKNVVTPFAFGVHESLLGMRLASPRRRLLAILIDLLCVALLTLLPHLWLSFFILMVVLYSLYTAKQNGNGPIVRLMLTGLSLCMMFVVAVQFFFSAVFVGDNATNLANNEVSNALNTGDDTPLIYSNNKLWGAYRLEVDGLNGPNGEVACAPGTVCGTEFFDALALDLMAQGYEQKETADIFIDVRELLAEKGRLETELTAVTLDQRLYSGWATYAAAKNDSKQGDELTQQQVNSVVAWLQGILGDLGVSFGWAAVYFNVLIAWWNGQTLGKRLLGIKVVRIDGGAINLWESIGRYGGYSAGLGTGLLGFMQIYWDANRQAIQDKISETLVVQP